MLLKFWTLNIILALQKLNYSLSFHRPAKLLITEEKLQAHLNGLHISSDYTEHTLASEELMDVGMEPPRVGDRNKIKGPKVVLSEELKRLQREPLLPAALIER